MKKYISIICIVLIPFLSLAQTDSSEYKIVYDFDLKTANLSVPNQQYIVLHAANRSISWIDLSGIPNDEKYNAPVNKGRDGKNQFVYKDFSKGEMVFESKSNLLPKDKNAFADSLHPMDWRITGEERLIDSFTCLSAECDFRGRKYTAWFTTAIPIGQGPWKFGGLPGLIIRLEDSEGKFTWRFNSFTPQNALIPPAPARTAGDYNEFTRLINGGFKKMQEMMKAQNDAVDPNCITCGQTTSVSFEMIEKF